MLATTIASLRFVQMALIVTTAGAALTAMPDAARATVVTILDDPFSTDTSANYNTTNNPSPNPGFVNTGTGTYTFSAPNQIFGRIQNNTNFNPTAGNITVTTTLLGINGFSSDTSAAGGIGASPVSASSTFIAAEVFATSGNIKLTTSAGDFSLRTTTGFGTGANSILTLNLLPATSQYEVTLTNAGSYNYDSGLRSLATDLPGFSFSSLGTSANPLMGGYFINATGSSRGVNVTEFAVTQDQTTPAPAAAPVLALGALAISRRRRIA